MAGIMVNASIGVMNSLLDKLTTLMGEEFAKLKNLRKEVNFIKDELTGMKDALVELSYLDELDPQTKRWRDIVREMSYDIEDIIDDFMQNFRERNKTTGLVRNTIECLKTLRARHKIAGQIEDIRNRVIETSSRRQRYNLYTPLYKLNTPQSSNVVIDQRVTALYEDAANLIGVEAPTNELVNLLADKDKQLKMVSIVGFGGLGKTTLANAVCGRIKGKFDLCAFVPVSQKPNIPKLLHSLLYQLGDTTSSHDMGLNVLLDKLRERLHNYRYLIVIDDIWDVQAWSFIKCAFPENNFGSRVIVTTRIQDVAKACCLHESDHILEMKPLSNEDSRRLFLNRIFGSEEDCPVQLRDLSVEILRRCGGLPLAIICISSMLASEGSNQKERWEYVRDSLGSRTNLTLEGVRKILNLSYKDLPSHLRTCLLYLGMYPEDYMIVRSNLERQWMAEGFISKEHGQDVEGVARSYFNELVNRSLIQPVDFDNRGLVTSCRVHDMMLDLIFVKAAEENFFTIVDDPQDITGLEYQIRRLSIRMQLDDPYDGTLISPRSINMSHVRSVMLFRNCRNTTCLSEFKFLRVLFSDSVITDLSGLWKACHLRYVHINGNLHNKIPINVGVLQQLETLHVYPPPKFVEPDLRIVLSDGICNIKSLRYLSGFDYAGNTLDNIKGLGELVNLRYLLLIHSSIPNDGERRRDALRSSMGRLTSLEDLLLIGMGKIDNLFPLSHPTTPYRLQTLRMSRGDCYFSRVPGWMGELRNLCDLKCHVVMLQSDCVGILAELPFLIDLDLSANSVERIAFSGKGFPGLERFKIDLGYSSASYLTFQPGAMSKVQRLEVISSARGSEQEEVAPAGLEHLLVLAEFSACVFVKKYDKTRVESAMRSAISMHPGNPRLVFRTS